MPSKRDVLEQLKRDELLAAADRLTNITEDVIRAVALPMELVDVKVCAVDEIWSA